jgi:hypothetical protein
MSGKFCRMFVDMSGKMFWGMPSPPPPPFPWGKILMLSLSVRANYTVLPPPKQDYAHTPMSPTHITSNKLEQLLFYISNRNTGWKLTRTFVLFEME